DLWSVRHPLREHSDQCLLHHRGYGATGARAPTHDIGEAHQLVDQLIGSPGASRGRTSVEPLETPGVALSSAIGSFWRYQVQVLPDTPQNPRSQGARESKNEECTPGPRLKHSGCAPPVQGRIHSHEDIRSIT